MSITVRICLMFLLVSGLGFYYFARQEIGDTTRRYREATEEPLVDFASVLAAIVAANSSNGELNVGALRTSFSQLSQLRLSAKIYNLLKTNVDVRIYVTDADGKVVFDSSGRDEGKDYLRWNNVWQTLHGSYGARSSNDDPLHPGSVLHVSAPIAVSGKLLGSLTVAKPNENANRFITVARKNTLVLGFMSFFTVAGLAVILSLIVTRPIHALTNYARDVRDGKRAVLPRLSSGELQTLGAAFEEMREALEGRKYVEQYVQTLTHEIKSPLTAIRGAVELLKENPPEPARTQFMQNIERETERAQDLVNKLLSLSALQRTNIIENAKRIEVRAVIEDLLARCAMQAQAKKVTLDFDGGEELHVLGDQFWLKEALVNVIQNAVEFAPAGSSIRIRLSQESTSAVIEVIDQGPGIPEWALGKIFDKFYSLPRPDTNKRSSGLGLNITQEVLQLHGGSITLANAAEGGAHACVRLPAIP